MLHIGFEAQIIEWRGPAPFFFAPVPEEHVEAVRHAAKLASYGWGVVPVTAIIGGVSFATSLFPRNGGYLLPLKDRVRKAAGITVDDTVQVAMSIAARDPLQ
jgi:hypothetical protein